MRVLMVTANLGDSYGQERVLRATTGGLKALDHEVYFLTDNISGPVPHCDGVWRIPGISKIDSLSPSLDVVNCERVLRAYAASAPPDVIHLIDVFDFRIIDLLTSLAPVVLTAHTVAPTCPSSTRHLPESNLVCEQKSGWGCLITDNEQGCLGTFRGPVRKAHVVQNFVLKKRFLKMLDGIAAISPYVARTLVDDGFPAEMIRVIPNPIVLPHKVEPKSKSEGPLPKNLIVVASRLVPLKGLSTLVTALAAMRDQEWTVWIYGDGTERKALEAQVELHSLGERVRFKGHASAGELFGVLSHATAFVQPNVGPEGFGLSAVEAAAFGVPVVVSSVPAFSEIFEHEKNALIFEAGNVQELRNAVIRILGDGALRGRLRNQGIQLRERYSLHYHLAPTLRLYAQVLERPARAAKRTFKKSLEMPTTIPAHTETIAEQ